MKNTGFRFALALSKIEKQHIQMILLTVAVLMLALGAGAPVDGGGIGH